RIALRAGGAGRTLCSIRSRVSPWQLHARGVELRHGLANRQESSFIIGQTLSRSGAVADCGRTVAMGNGRPAAWARIGVRSRKDRWDARSSPDDAAKYK